MDAVRNLASEKLVARLTNQTNDNNLELYTILRDREQDTEQPSVDTKRKESREAQERTLTLARVSKLYKAGRMPFIDPGLLDLVLIKRKLLSPMTTELGITQKRDLCTMRAKSARVARSRRQLERLVSAQEGNRHLDLSLIFPSSVTRQEERTEVVDPKSTARNVKPSAPIGEPPRGRRGLRPQTSVGFGRRDRLRSTHDEDEAASGTAEEDGSCLYRSTHISHKSVRKTFRAKSAPQTTNRAQFLNIVHVLHKSRPS